MNLMLGIFRLLFWYPNGIGLAIMAAKHYSRALLGVTDLSRIYTGMLARHNLCRPSDAFLELTS